MGFSHPSVCPLLIYRHRYLLVLSSNEVCAKQWMFYIALLGGLRMLFKLHYFFLQSVGNGEKSSTESGVINYQVNGTKKMIFFYSKDCDPKNFPRIGDKVSITIDCSTCLIPVMTCRLGTSAFLSIHIVECSSVHFPVLYCKGQLQLS
jgi:hypothetical protein